MITSSIGVKHHDELIREQGALCTRIEAGNPFSAGQELILSSGDLTPRKETSFCDFESGCDPDPRAATLMRHTLEATVTRAQRLPNSLAAANAVALDYIRVGDLDAAITQIKRVLAIDPEYFPALANLAKCYSAKGDLEGALYIYRTLEAKHSTDPKVLINMALIYLKMRQFDNALVYFERARKIAPKNHAVLNNIGLIHLVNRNVTSAISFIRQAAKIKNDDPAIYNNLGVAFVARNDYRKAIANFKVAHSLYKSGKDIVNNLANAFQAVGEHEKAIKLISDYLSIHPEEMQLRHVLAWSLFQTHSYQQCLEQLRSLVKSVNPNNKKAHAAFLNNMGIVHLKMGELLQAKDCLINSINRYPNNPLFVYCNLLDVYFRLWQLDKAWELIEDASTLYNNHPLLLSYRGMYYLRRSDYTKAKELFERALETDPALLSPYVDLPVIEIDIEGNCERALDILRKGLDKYPDNIALINNYAYCLIVMGDLRKAREVLENVKEESFIPLMATRGLLLIKEGNIEEGRRLYNRAIGLSRHDKNLVALIEQKKNLELGIYYIEGGNKREGIRLLRKGLKYKPREDRYERKLIEVLARFLDAK